MKCEKCSSNCELVNPRFPWHEGYWICEKCDGTYCNEDDGQKEAYKDWECTMADGLDESNDWGEKQMIGISEGNDPPAEFPPVKYINVNGREEHEALLKNQMKMLDLGLDPYYERMVYLKRWGGWLKETEV